MEEVDKVLFEVREEILLQKKKWEPQHDENLSVCDWISIVVKQLGKAVSENENHFLHNFERGVDRRFIKIAAVCVSAVIARRKNFI